LHKFILTATCFDSNESSSGHPKNYSKAYLVLKFILGTQKLSANSTVNWNGIIIIY